MSSNENSNKKIRKQYTLMDYKSSEGICIPMNYEKYKKKEEDLITNEFYTGIFPYKSLQRRIQSYKNDYNTNMNDNYYSDDEYSDDFIDFDLLETQQDSQDCTDEEDDYFENYQYD